MSSNKLREGARLIGEQQMSEQEAKLFRLYGKLPNKKDLLQNKLKVCRVARPPYKSSG